MPSSAGFAVAVPPAPIEPAAPGVPTLTVVAVRTAVDEPALMTPMLGPPAPPPPAPPTPPSPPLPPATTKAPQAVVNLLVSSCSVLLSGFGSPGLRFRPAAGPAGTTPGGRGDAQLPVAFQKT